MLPDTCYTVKSEWITLNYKYLNMEKPSRNMQKLLKALFTNLAIYGKPACFFLS